jgi:hypothetical protein
MTRSEALLIISKSEVTADSSRDWEKLSLAWLLSRFEVQSR